MIPPEGFILERTLRSHPDIRIELERAVLFDTEAAPYVWITNGTNGTNETIEEAIESESEITHVEIIEHVGNELLAEIDWNDRENGLVRTLIETKATCLKCVGVSDAWHFTLRFATSTGLAECYQRCLDEDRRMAIKSVRSGGQSKNRHFASNLSDPQREAIYAALESGYFSIPRQVTLQELADELGISDTATSQRIRRALETLLMDMLPGVHPDVEVPFPHSKAPFDSIQG